MEIISRLALRSIQMFFYMECDSQGKKIQDKDWVKSKRGNWSGNHVLDIYHLTNFGWTTKKHRLSIFSSNCYQTTVSRLICLHTDTFSATFLPAVVYIFPLKKQRCLFHFLRSSWSNLGSSPPPHLFLSLRPPLPSSIFHLGLIEVSGRSRNVAGVCLPF